MIVDLIAHVHGSGVAVCVQAYEVLVGQECRRTLKVNIEMIHADIFCCVGFVEPIRYALVQCCGY